MTVMVIVITTLMIIVLMLQVVTIVSAMICVDRGREALRRRFL